VSEPDLHNRTPGVVTVYGDLACPWASLAIAGLRAARDRLGATVHLDIRSFPLELVNGQPHDFALIESEKPVIVGLAPHLAWQRWRGEESAWPMTTLLPMEAVQAAKRPDIGGVPASEELDAALRRALFVDSRCIAMMTVVLEVAEECADIDRAALGRALARGAGREEVFAQAGQHDRGAVRGSPHIFLSDGRDWLNPGVDLDHAGDYPVVKRYDPTVYEEIIRCA
jgi:predicted DsbA family dithiol-disulfide isomerase